MSLELIVTLLIAGGALVLLVELAIRSTPAGAALLLLHLVVDYAGIGIPNLSIGGTNVYALDCIVAVLVAAGVARLLRSRRPNGTQLLLVLVSLIALLSVIQGVAAFGLQTAVNEARPWLLLLGVGLYFSTIDPSPHVIDRVSRYLMWAGIAVGGFAVLRWMAWPLGLSSGIFESATGTFRVINSDQAILVAQAFFLLTPVWRAQGKVAERVLAAGLLAVVVLAQHRTVWIALAAALLVLLVRDRTLGRRFLILLVAAVIGVAVLATTVLGAESDDLREQATGVGTWEWRVEGWKDLIRQHESPKPEEVALGLPFGSGWEREVSGIRRVESPHSIYVEALLRLGVVGLLGFVACHLLAARTALRENVDVDAYPQLGGNVLLCLLVLQVMYGIAYASPATGGIILGIALAKSRRAAERPGAETPAEVPA